MNKIQIPLTPSLSPPEERVRSVRLATEVRGVLVIGNWYFEIIWNLGFVIWNLEGIDPCDSTLIPISRP